MKKSQYAESVIKAAKAAAKQTEALARKRLVVAEAELDAKRSELLYARAMNSLIKGLEDGFRNSS
jgi:hypothetical protein